MIRLVNSDNRNILLEEKAQLIYADFVYENLDFTWFRMYQEFLVKNGIFIIQTDWHSDYLVRLFVGNNYPNFTFVNHLVWKNEWGNHPKNKFHQCYDSILIYCNGTDWRFYSERIQVPKVTKNKGLNPSGRETKTATAWIDDICLTTTAKERVKKDDGHLIRWQKPQKLYDRIIAPFTDEGDLILDPFAGSGSLGLWCKNNNRNYIGIEIDPEVYRLAERNINGDS